MPGTIRSVVYNTPVLQLFDNSSLVKWKLLDEDCSMKYEKAYNCLIGHMNFIDHGLVL